MAKRTIRRNPMSVDTDDYDLDEQYFNFMQFKGLCTNKNYVGIDQNTFDRVNNMYIDQDDQLSTRPPVKRSNNLPASDVVVDMFKVNNIVFYNVKDGDNYTLKFKYHDELRTLSSAENVKVMWFDDKYIVFMDDNLIGFNWDYDNNEMHEYTKEDLIYLPITSIVNGTQIEEYESPNILTDGYITRYVFNSTQATNTDNLIGTEVTVDVDEDTQFTVENFVKNNERVFVKRAGNIKVDIVLVDPTFGRIVAYKKEDTFLLFSIDANNFYTIPYPTATCKAPVISDDGDALYIADTAHAAVYYLDLSSIADNGIDGIGSLVWTKIEYSLPQIRVNGVARNMGSYLVFDNTEVSNFNVTDVITPFGHSPEKGAAFMYLSATCDIDTYYNRSNTWSSDDSQGKYERPNATTMFFVIVDGTSAKAYLDVDIDLNVTGKNFDNETVAARDAVHKLRYIKGNDYSVAMINSPLFGYTNYNVSNPSAYMTPDIFVLVRNGEPVHSIRKFGTGVANYQNLPYYRQGTLENYGTTEPIIINPSEYYLGNYYNYDMTASRQADVCSFKYFEKNGYKSVSVEGYTYNYIDPSYSELEYTFSTNMDTAESQQANRESMPYSVDLTKTLYTDIDVDMTYAKMATGPNVLGNNYLHYADDNIPLLQNDDNLIANYRPVYVDNSTIIYYDINTGYLWTSNYEGTISADVVTWPDGEPSYKTFVPNLAYNFVSNVISSNNVMHWSSKREGQVYFPEIDSNAFEDDITAFVTFSQTSLGVFLEDSVYEFRYDTDKDAYLLTPTKLILGNRKGSEVLLSYDGSNIFVTTLKGLSALNYQDFVQSTEQTYSYLTENVMTEYDLFNTSPIKLYQYKDWLFMYKQDSPIMLILDVRTSSWWVWTLNYNVTRMVFDGSELLILLNNKLEHFDFITKSVYDDDVHPFNWVVESQKLHFGAPNNYKHIRSLTVITTETHRSLRYKLNFTNYRNLNNLSDTDTVEYEVDALGSLIKRVNFIKTNAFQFKICNDPTDNTPKAFVTSDVALKYRITERVR